MAYGLTMGRGHTLKLSIAVVLSGLPYNLTGCSLKITAKKSREDADGSAVFQVVGVITDAANGLVSFTVAASATSSLPAMEMKLPFDIQLTSATSEKFTILDGILTVKLPVTT